MNLDSFKTQLLLVFAVSLAPIIALLVRGVPWGADSLGYWAYACGNYASGIGLHPDFFLAFLSNVVGCNLFLLAGIMLALYFFALVSLWLIGKHFFGEKEAFRLPIYVGSLTPLFFIEALRLESQFFGWTMAFIALGLFLVSLKSRNKIIKAVSFVLCLVLWLFSLNIWFAIVFLVPFMLLFLNLDVRLKQAGIFLVFLAGIIMQWGYILNSFNFESMVAEEMPLIGLIFIIHIIHYWKKIPQPFLFYGVLLIVAGLLKSKYMFLATPLLLVALLDKQLKEGIVLKRRIFGIKEIPVMYVAMILLVGWMVTSVSLYPTNDNLKEMNQAINLAKDENVLLYNDWGDGWTLEYLSYTTEYKRFPPNPDWNKMPRPYVAYTNEKLDCNKKAKKTYYCN